jgi:hypothetical protein
MRLRQLGLSVLLVACLTVGRAQDSSRASAKYGTLVVEMTLDDVYKTPPKDVYIEAHTFNANNISEKSFVFKMVAAGRYEAELPPGVYDVLISHPTSAPRCRRVSITSSYTGYWTLMLEHDEVYLQR